MDPGAIYGILRESAVEFGRQLRRRRIRWGWAQDTAAKWGKAAGIIHPFSSQWSDLENGKLKNPGPMLFHSLAVMNLCLADGNYGKVADIDLRERLQQAQPITHPDGRAWDAGDFWQAYQGLLPWPAEDSPVVTAETTAAWCEQFRQWFRAIARDSGRPPLEAARTFLRMINDDAQAQLLEPMLMGFADLTPDQLLALWDSKAGTWKLERWLEAWRDAEAPGLTLRETVEGLDIDQKP